MMGFLVDDLLDYAQLKNGKFRKVIKKFDLREAIEEVILIGSEKAKMLGITLNSRFKAQSVFDNCRMPISLFNKAENDHNIQSLDPEQDIETADSKKRRRFDRIEVEGKLHPDEKL